MTDRLTEAEPVLNCTVGVVPLPDELLVFKNRDLRWGMVPPERHLYEQSRRARLLRGVNIPLDVLEGVSIGVNRDGVCVANTHADSTDDTSYDMLCEDLLEGVRTREDVVRIARAAVAERAYQGGRILVAAPGWAYLVEVHRRLLRYRALRGRFVLTNHYTLIDPVSVGRPKPEPGGRSCSRERVGTDLAKAARSLGAVKALLRSHIPEKGEKSICNHGPKGGTESSHILQVRPDAITWWSLLGAPCENDYQPVKVKWRR